MYSSLPWWQRALSVLAGGVLLVLFWKGVIVLNLVPAILLPSPLDVGQALVRLAGSAGFWQNLTATVWTWLAGILVGTLVGATTGILVGVNRFVWAAVEPWVEFLRALPSVVLVPLVSLFLGVGASSRLACSAIVVAALLVSTAGTALRSASQAHLRLAIAWRASWWQTVAHFLLPAAVSHMAVALKAAIPIALIVAVAADMLIATDAGIGKIIMDALAVFDTSTMYGAIVVVGLLGYVAAVLGSVIERLAIHWSGQ
ncbi:MAG: ABC transporter permease subunit [Nitrospirae bacterium]|nr:ABC transporter permease subunit [Nitrospirota bacterium]